MRTWITISAIFLSALLVTAGELKTLSWNTKHAAPPAKLDKKKHLLPLIRFGVSALPEPKVMQLTFLGGTALGLPKEEARSLQSLLADRYQKIATDETFANAPSALAYCYSTTKPKTGRASLYLPKSSTAKSNVILFLHGYGGSFTFYQHYLASTFPNHIIICPAYGISCSHIPSTYLQECLDTTSKELGFQLKRPVLIGLSAGGFGGFREYSRRPASYAGYVCLAAFPPKDMVTRSPRKGRIRLVAGRDEVFVKNKTLQRAEWRLKHRTSDYSSLLIPDQGHFFILGAEDATKKALKTWDAELQK